MGLVFRRKGEKHNMRRLSQVSRILDPLLAYKGFTESGLEFINYVCLDDTYIPMYLYIEF